MKKCDVCKTMNPDTVTFCTVCGYKFTNSDNSTLNSTSEEQKNKVPTESKPKLFEYKVVSSLWNEIAKRHIDEIKKQNYEAQFTNSLMTDFLNELGSEGWELVMQENSNQHVLVFKREKR